MGHEVERKFLTVSDAWRERAEPGVSRLVGLHTMHLGPDAVLVVARVQFRSDLHVADIEAAVERLEQRIAPLAGSETTRRMIVVEPAAGAQPPST